MSKVLPKTALSAPNLRLAGLILLVLYILAGIAYSIYIPRVLRFGDEKEYIGLAMNMLHGPGYSFDGVHLTAMRPPGYSMFLAGIAGLGGGLVVMRIVQILLIAGTILLVCRFCAVGQRTGLLLVVTILVALYPVFIYTSGALYPQTLAGFLFMAALVLMTLPNAGIVAELAAGIIFGALILAVPTFGLTFLVVLAAAWLLNILSWRGVLMMIVGGSLVIGSWTARNAVEFHRLIPLASNSGENLLIGNCENTVPYGGAGNVSIKHYMAEAKAQGLDEFDTDHYLQRSAIKWITTHPGAALKLYIEKTLNFFNVWNEYSKRSDNEMSTSKQAAMAVSYLLLLALLAWRLWESKRFPLSATEKLCLIVYVLSAFTSAIFVTRIRYRLPYDYLIIAVIAGHLSHRLSLLVRKST